MTFSIVARCEQSGMFGVAVASSSPCVAARCAYAEAGAGAIASQNVTDPTLGMRGLKLMAQGASAPQTIQILKDTGNHIDYRQVTAVDSQGRTAIHSGVHTLGTQAEAQATNIACAGNLLADPGIPQVMVEAFQSTSAPLGDRLLAAMHAAIAAGGEQGPVHSAGMKLVREVAWPVADLRVDWCDACPITELEKIWQLYKPQLEDYITRALTPASAPSYGVPGDM